MRIKLKGMKRFSELGFERVKMRVVVKRGQAFRLMKSFLLPKVRSESLETFEIWQLLEVRILLKDSLLAIVLLSIFLSFPPGEREKITHPNAQAAIPRLFTAQIFHSSNAVHSRCHRSIRRLHTGFLFGKLFRPSISRWTYFKFCFLSLSMDLAMATTCRIWCFCKHSWDYRSPWVSWRVAPR